MSQDLVTTNYTPEQMRLITDVIAKGANKDELELFLYRCKNLGLDPLKPGQIYFVKYGSSPGTIVVGIEGFRARAARTGKLAGIKRGAIKSDKGALIGAWAEVYRADWKEPAREEIELSEYDTKKAMWAKMPSTMCKKVAEAAALRMAFPDELGGVYERSEMDQADSPPPERPSLPAASVDVSSALFIGGDYVINFGKKYKGMMLRDIPIEESEAYAAWLENNSLSKGQQPSRECMELKDAIAAYKAEPKKLGDEPPPLTDADITF